MVILPALTNPTKTIWSHFSSTSLRFRNSIYYTLFSVLPDQLDLSTRNYKLSLDVKQLFTAGSINTSGKVIRYDKGIVHIMDE